jgi:hypothetical protein
MPPRTLTKSASARSRCPETHARARSRTSSSARKGADASSEGGWQAQTCRDRRQKTLPHVRPVGRRATQPCPCAARPFSVASISGFAAVRTGWRAVVPQTQVMLGSGA